MPTKDKDTGARTESTGRGRPFRKGFDPRCHQFTPEERSRGFWAAMAVMGISTGEKLHTSGRWPSYKGKGGAR